MGRKNERMFYIIGLSLRALDLQYQLKLLWIEILLGGIGCGMAENTA